MDAAAFHADAKTLATVERKFLVIGVAASRLGDQTARLRPGLPWQNIRASATVSPLRGAASFSLVVFRIGDEETYDVLRDPSSLRPQWHMMLFAVASSRHVAVVRNAVGIVLSALLWSTCSSSPTTPSQTTACRDGTVSTGSMTAQIDGTACGARVCRQLAMLRSSVISTCGDMTLATALRFGSMLGARVIFSVPCL
jgi:hypothetical protein